VKPPTELTLQDEATWKFELTDADGEDSARFVVDLLRCRPNFSNGLAGGFCIRPSLVSTLVLVWIASIVEVVDECGIQLI
jgi:hypothetical protein